MLKFIIIVICSINNPNQCERVVQPLEHAASTAFQCMHYGQAAMIALLRDRPDVRISRWSCGDEKQIAKF